MRYGLCVANIGSYSDPRVVVELATSAERNGWESLFVWDHLAFVWGAPAADPWVMLGAVAGATERMLIGTAVTPVARRRPHVLAHQLATLDQLSSGRVVFGAGLGGSPSEFARFGEPAGEEARAERLDEGLEVVRALLSGERVERAGSHYVVDDVTLAPPPVQRHLPIWIGGNRPASLRRAARWDGWLADGAPPRGESLTPEQLERSIERIGRGDGFEVAVIGDSTQLPAEAFCAAGATWWLETIHDRRLDLDAARRLVAAGPGKT